jgi:hypothetical protein
MTRNYAELGAAIAELGLDYVAAFVPQSQSRHADRKEPSLNWRVTLKAKNGVTLTTDYMQGIGHMPGYQQFLSIEQDERRKNAAERGKYFPRDHVSDFNFGEKPLPPPALHDVLYSLVLDADAIEYAVFEDWADANGYDADSRSAEKTYRACLDIGLQLRAMIGDAGIARLRELFSD